MLQVPDPAPSGLVEVGRLGASGGAVSGSGVTVQAPVRSIGGGDQVVVSVAPSPGVVAGERWGTPVEVVHDAPLSDPLTVGWDLEGLSDAQRAGLMLVKWEPSISAWVPQSVDYQVEGGVLTVQTSAFSVWNWVVNNVSDSSARVGQAVGEVIGKRVDQPICEGELHPWVRQAISPSEDMEAAAIGVCFEPDHDEALTVRVSNNRTFTQVMAMTEGDQKWAWTWSGEQWFGIEQTAYDSARLVFDTDTRYLLPPLHEVAVGVGRPGSAGSHLIAAESTVSPASIAVDVMTYLLNQLPVGGLTNPTLNSAVQALYECSGKQLVAGSFSSVEGAGRAVVDAITGCADQMQQDPRFFADLLGRSAEQVKSARAVQYLTKAAAVLRYADLAFYTSDQVANALVGPLTWTIRGSGRAAPLGAWAATCTDVDIDSGRLWQNLALRDEFSDTSIEYHDFPGWASAAEEAVAPLQDCDPAYRGKLAAWLVSSWGDAEAAGIVADLLRGSGSSVTQEIVQALEIPAGTCGDGITSGWDQYAPIQLTGGQGEQFDADLRGAGILGATLVGAVDVTGDGLDEAVVSLQCTGSPREQCCAGRTSIVDMIAVLDLSGGSVRRVGNTITPTEVLAPGGELQPRSFDGKEASIDGTTVVTYQRLVYPESVEGPVAEQLEGEVRYEYADGSWVPVS